MCSVYVLLARQAPRAVVLRRGPSRQVQLLTWDLDTDVVTEGQWLKGRIYEQNCDLSPDGRYFLYHAAKYGRWPEPETWTAISQPPSLTALSLWLHGGAYLGGGLFNDEGEPRLNDPPSLEVEDGFSDNGWHVEAMDDADPYLTRLRRDGWQWVALPFQIHAPTGRRIRQPPPEAMIKPSPADRDIHLRVCHTSPYWASPRRKPIHHQLVRGDVVVPLPGVEWADWDRNGDLLSAADGRLRRLTAADALALRPEAARVVADLSAMRYAVRPPPEGYAY